MDSRNNETEGFTRLTRQGIILLDRNFNTGRHVLREICRKFDRISSVKRTSPYKSRADPAKKTHFIISQIHLLRLGPQTT